MSTVLIRDAKLSDAPRLLEIYSYYVKNTAITFEYNVPSLEEFRHRMKNITLRYPYICLLYTSPSPRDGATSRMPSSA